MRNGSYIPNNIHGISFARWVQMLLLCSGYGFFSSSSSFVFVWCCCCFFVFSFFFLHSFRLVRSFIRLFSLSVCTFAWVWLVLCYDVCAGHMNECNKRIWIRDFDTQQTQRAHECDRNGWCKNKCGYDRDGKNHGQTDGIDTNTIYIVYIFSYRRESNLCIIVRFGSVRFGLGSLCHCLLFIYF